jgi:arginine:ornithine antiporter / lysine permease
VSNYIVTVAKVVPILVFIVIAIIAFKADAFANKSWGDEDYSTSLLWDQATRTMLITVFVFLSVLSVFALVTLVSYGVRPQGELAGASQPSMAAVLGSIVGPWGSVLIRVGVIVSVLGA